MIWLVALLVLPGAPDDAARAELAALRDGFAARPRAATEADLVALAARWPSTEAAGRALLWCGELELADGDSAAARARFDEVARRFPRGELQALARRGLGNLALADGRYRAALAQFDRAAADAPPAVAAELRQRRALARRLERRFFVEVAAWIGFAAALAWFARRLRRPLRLPAATLYLAPIHLILVAGCAGRDALAARALAWLGGGSLLLTTVALAGPPERRRARLAADALVVALAVAALAWIALRRAGIVDQTWNALGVALAD